MGEPMLATKDVTDRIKLVDFVSDGSNHVRIGISMESNYIYSRTREGITITLPDYFADLPDHVLTDAVLNVIRMENERQTLRTDFIDDDVLCTRNRLRRLRQTKEFRFTQKGRNKDISRAIDNLLDMGLIEGADIQNASFTWANRVSNDYLGICLMNYRIVAINPFLDYKIVSWEAFEEVVYHEILHLRQRNMGLQLEDYHDEQFRMWERRYPYFEKASENLESVGEDITKVSKMARPPRDIDPADRMRKMLRFQPTGLLRSFFPRPVENVPVIGLGFSETEGCYYRIEQAFEFQTGERGVIVTLDYRLLDATPDVIRAIRKDIAYSIFTSEPNQNGAVLDFLDRHSGYSAEIQTKIDPSKWTGNGPKECAPNGAR